MRTITPTCSQDAPQADLDWRQRGACRDEDPELFFETGTGGAGRAQIEEAKAVCRRCPVVDDCLAWALDAGQAYGVAGGMSEKERRKLVDRQNSYEKRKTDVAQMVADGLDSEQIAQKLGLTRKALRTWSKSHGVTIPAARRPSRAVAA